MNEEKIPIQIVSVLGDRSGYTYAENLLSYMINNVIQANVHSDQYVVLCKDFFDAKDTVGKYLKKEAVKTIKMKDITGKEISVLSF